MNEDLQTFITNTEERPENSCSASGDCDVERDAALAEIKRLRAVAAWASAQLESYHPDLIRVQEVLTEEAPTREMFFAALPDWDWEVKGGTWDEPRWAYEEHPWYAQLGITQEECDAFWDARSHR